MKVLVAAPTYLPSRRANTIQVMKMAQALQSIGHGVRVLVPGRKDDEIQSWDDLSSLYGLKEKIDVHWFPVYPRLRSYDYGYRVIAGFHQWEADILYTRLPQAAAFASLIGIPTIFEVHDLPGGRFGLWLFRRFLNGPGAFRLVLISRSLRDDLDHIVGPLPDYPFTLVAPDGVDLDRFENIPTPIEARASLKLSALPQLPIKAFTIGYTGHLYEGRGARLILELARQIPEFSFLMAGGDPDDVARIGFQVKRLGLKNVYLTGFIPNRKLPDYQAACDVLLMPYQWTVAASSGGNIASYLSPMKLFEYLACGRVILSSDLPVLREILSEENAILLPPDDIHSWKKALKEISQDLPRQHLLGQQAREDSKKYSWKSRAENILAFDLPLQSR